MEATTQPLRSWMRETPSVEQRAERMAADSAAGLLTMTIGAEAVGLIAEAQSQEM